MKKIMSLVLVLLLLFSFASCGDRDIVDNSSAGDNSINKTYATNMMKTSELEFYDPKKDGYPERTEQRGYFGDPYLLRVDNYFDVLVQLGFDRHSPVKIPMHQEFSPDDIYVEHNVSRMPYIYYLIREFNVSKEDFEKANQIVMQEHIDDWTTGTDEYYFTEKDIEMLYSDDLNAVREYFLSPWSFIVEDRIYTVGFLTVMPIEKWKEENIPLSSITEFWETFKPDCFNKYMGFTGSIASRDDLEKLSNKIKEYEKLLAE